MQWFEVDKQGLAKLLDSKGKAFAVFELVQNAWDEESSAVNIELTPAKKVGFWNLTVRDDNPEGFKNLSYAFTLFAESPKKDKADKRGRFNLGEKLVLALCEEASVTSTTGQIVFNKTGRHNGTERTETGTIFSGRIKMTDDEAEEVAVAVKNLLPPENVVTTFNGVAIASRQPVTVVEGLELATVLADSEGYLRPTKRKTNVEVFEPLPGETATLYEMGIPIVATGDRWHLNVKQKVPLTIDRENVPPAYLGRVRAAVTESLAANLTEEDANSTWVKDALARNPDLIADETVERLATLRFGDKRVAYDPNDPEANQLAASKGYTVIHGGALSGGEWAAMRRAGAILPAGKVTPAPKPFGDGDPSKLVPPEKMTPALRAYEAFAKTVAWELMKVEITVNFTTDATANYAAAYGPGRLTMNVGRLGYRWFEADPVPIYDLTIHEFGHQYSGNHLSEEYYDALTRLGGKLAQLALDQPGVFKKFLIDRTAVKRAAVAKTG